MGPPRTRSTTQRSGLVVLMKDKPFQQEAPVDAIHGQDDGEKQAHADDGGDEAPFMKLEVING